MLIILCLNKAKGIGISVKLLVSAYACRPCTGSEPAVGWNWVLEYAKLCELVVLTNYTNKPYIEKYLEKNESDLKNVRFIYVKPKMKVRLWYREWKRMERPYYFFWQHSALKEAKKLCKEEQFDFVQHITYVSCVLPTYMYKLGIPFIYGPVAGGEMVPSIIKYPFGVKERIIEKIRMCLQILIKNSFHLKQCCKHAQLIIAVTSESKEMIPKQYQKKVVILQAIGLNKRAIIVKEKETQNNIPQFLMAGRMLSWKGLSIGIEAFVKALQHGTKAELTVLGTGDKKMKENLKKIAGNYCNKEIRFIESIDYDKMLEFYDKFDVLINCSLRDSGCLVVMEAMGRGLPIICINTGGPKVNTNSGGAIRIEPEKYNILCGKVAESITLLANDTEKRKGLSQDCRAIALKEFEYETKIKNFYLKYLGKEDV